MRREHRRWHVSRSPQRIGAVRPRRVGLMADPGQPRRCAGRHQLRLAHSHAVVSCPDRGFSITTVQEAYLEEPAFVMPPGSTALARVSIALRMLAEARDLIDVMPIHDWAEQFQEVAKIAGASRDTINLAAEVKLVAERKAGDFLKQMAMNRGGRPSETPNVLLGVSGSAPMPTLAELGITYRESSDWQIEAGVSAADFEEYVAQVKAAGRLLTTAGLVRFARARAAAEAEAAAAAAGAPRGRLLMDLILPPGPSAISTRLAAPAAPSDDDLIEIFRSWLRASDALCRVDPADVAEVFGDNLAEAEEAAFERIARWYERFREARIDATQAGSEAE